MKKMKYLRSWLTIALVVTIIGSLTGGTVAWFTDSVESTSNIVKTGTLDVELSYAEKLGNAETPTDWKNADSGAIFDYKYWEPGYTQVRYVKIENVGDLAFKFKLNVKPSSILGTVTEENGEIIFTPNEPAPEFPLEGVIDVYMLPVDENFVAPTSFADLKSKFPADYDAPSILELIGDKDGAAYGVMLPAEGKGSSDHIDAPADVLVGEQEFMIALHMQEEADNRYQNMSIGDGFAIQLEAAQYMYEKDSFDEQYDKDAEYAGLPSAVVVALDDEAFAASGLPEGAAAYMFRTTDTPDVQANPELLNNPYRYWHADFVVSFDQDVAAGSATLAGQYNAWSENWVAFSTFEDYEAGQEIRLLGDVGKLMNNGNPIYINYEELALIQQFNCGAYAEEGTNAGTTMTVELRLYETTGDPTTPDGPKNIETGYYETLGFFTYTFPAAE